ncbi:hypothetical protein [Actinoplanes utahensis]|uniref:hypothetical protein n=1 Tax=Actinoplanes utahensis TaxID=1869 RepID=UPI00068B0E3B|nr:hypothetical protein [Actinoplanes utahensis]GIF32070.1 hypothetical protein Aut01nite_50560 [Actinoplanes utahensis]
MNPRSRFLGTAVVLGAVLLAIMAFLARSAESQDLLDKGAGVVGALVAPAALPFAVWTRGDQAPAGRAEDDTLEGFARPLRERWTREAARRGCSPGIRWG